MVVEMTRLLTPSPGEVLDRLTILSLKIQAFEKKGLDASDFEAEKQSLQDYLENWKQELRSNLCHLKEAEAIDTWNKIGEKTTGLLAVNSLLWDSEDQVRATNQLEITRLASLCLRIAKLNDSRGVLVRELSNLYQAGDHQEKIFGVAIGRS
jgi:hypothetical protein